MIAVTRQTFGSSASIVADSIVVSGSGTPARLSHERTGFVPTIAGFGVVDISRGIGGSWARPVASGLRKASTDMRTVGRMRVMIPAGSGPRWILMWVLGQTCPDPCHKYGTIGTCARPSISLMECTAS